MTKVSKITTNALTEKGVLRKDVKDAIKTHEFNTLEDILVEDGYEKNKKGTGFMKTFTDVNGIDFYAVLEFKTTTLHPDNVKVTKTDSKSKSKTPVEIVFDEPTGEDEDDAPAVASN